MSARIFLFLTFLLSITHPVWGEISYPHEVESFFSTRQVLLTLPFKPGHSRLTPEAKKEIDLVIPCLVAVDENNFIYRVEGFSSKDGEDAGNIEVSMERAKSVVDYITQQHGLLNNLFLTGVGERPFMDLPSDPKVEIALYDDLLNVCSKVVERCTQDLRVFVPCPKDDEPSEESL